MGEGMTLDERCINTIRFLAADAIEKAKSGHPGMPMGAAAAAYVLWTRHLKHNPADPLWDDRDRFVLSAGHGSMLLYTLLYLSGYNLSLEDLQAFRQWGSKTPGHPERQHPPGAEMTTGPLGQGLGAAVGMAIAEAHLAARYNRPDHRIMDHFTYVFASDGDLMEGLSCEACALAGHLGLGKLIVLYDDNRISLAGATTLCFTENCDQRFAACGWQVIPVEDGNDVAAVDAALASAKAETSRPTLIRLRTTIGFGAPGKQNTSACHGSPLGSEELRAARENLGWPLAPLFFVPEEALAHFRAAAAESAKRHEVWKDALRHYAVDHPEAAAEFERVMKGDLPARWEAAIPSYGPGTKDVATRKTSEAILQALAPVIPELMGGSADLNPSTFTWLKGLGDFQKPGDPPASREGALGGEWGYGGRNIHFGVREHAMAAIAGGMAIHGGAIPFTGTFFTFADYMRPSIRLAALMGLRVIYVFTHDSVGVGEDGPTHQPVEHLMSLRGIPNLTVIRPADANETAEAWRVALGRGDGPTALIFTRQNLPVLDRSVFGPAAGLRKGGYILWESVEGTPEAILIGTGSEVQIALEAGKTLAEEGTRVRVVSLPSWELFDRQPQAWRDQVLPPSVRARVAVEAGRSLGWEHYVGLEGAVVGIDRFGASAPYQVIYEKFGITAEAVAAAARRLLVLRGSRA
ncbi:MAG: transketolase [Proteobacteria bacterium]|nr:transketolase [Pseudomonadota bacterium]MBU2226442.1 transketolase [Pseudomonadota bacterium]MBU2260445.1 transketolase [Pseudomonadota bacterium]